MFSPYVVIDDVFENIDEIVDEYKNTQLYDIESLYKLTGRQNLLTEGWPGYRSEDLFTYEKTQPLASSCINTILIKALEQSKLTTNKYFIEWTGCVYFHKMEDEHQQIPSWFHVDDVNNFACMVYLNKDPPADTGTDIVVDGKVISIENKYNRAVLFNANLMHSPKNGFGHGDNSRMTMNIFIINLGIMVVGK